MRNNYQKGLSVTELLIVIAGIALLVAFVLPQFFKLRENQTLKSAVGDILSILDKARANTLASVNSSEYGVHLESDKVIIFKGNTFDVNDTNNETINITTPASISNVTLNGISGSSGDVYFQRVYGVPSKSGTITVSTTSSSKIITLSSTGVASSN